MKKNYKYKLYITTDMQFTCKFDYTITEQP